MKTEQKNYVRYSPDVEFKQENEDEDIAAIRASFARGRIAAYEKHRHAVRDAHRLGRSGVSCDFIIKLRF